MADAAWGRIQVSETAHTPRRAIVLRVTHWVTAICFLTLLLSGVEVLISHPRFYWGEAGSVESPALFQIPIPASRRSVPTGYGYVLPDQNGWSRALHFQSAWTLVLAGLLYGAWGIWSGHFSRNLLPGRTDLTPKAIAAVIAGHLRRHEQSASYNGLQRLTYTLVIFLLFPLTVWTGLAMSPALASAFPFLVTVFGGQQSARTVHFFLAIALVLFLGIHVAMVALAGFRKRMRAMITGN